MRQRLSEIGWRTAIVLLVPSTFTTTRAAAQDQPLNAAALFLLFPVGATTVGMGQTAAAADGHGEVVFQNPAGVASLSSSEFALHTASLAAGPTNALTAFFPRHGIGVFGATLYLADYGDLELTDSTGTTTGRLSSRNFAFLATFATQLTGSVSLGVSYKLVQFAVTCSGSGACQSVTSGQGVTHALDVGGQFTVGADHALRIGVALRNVGFPLQVNNRDQADPLPTRLTVGATYRVQLRPVDDSVADRFDLRMAADVESPWRQTGNPDIRLGVDVGYRELVRVRGGYAFVHQGLSGPSIGLGVATGAIGVDLARMFLTGTDLVTPNPTFLSFRVEF
jgi:uncharacterized protein UPF0164